MKPCKIMQGCKNRNILSGYLAFSVIPYTYRTSKNTKNQFKYNPNPNPNQKYYASPQRLNYLDPQR